MEPFRAEIEALVLARVRPLPASDLRGNAEDYALLAAIRPDNSVYAERLAHYTDRIERERRAVLAWLRKSEDKVADVTFYHHVNAPPRLNTRSTVELYIGANNRGGQPWLRMRIMYTADTWLFVRRVDTWFSVGDRGVRETFYTGPFERDNNSRIWEWVDVVPDEYQLVVLRSLAESREAILRFEGTQYRRDVTLSERDKRALIDILDAHEIMVEDALKGPARSASRASGGG